MKKVLLTSKTKNLLIIGFFLTNINSALAYDINNCSEKHVDMIDEAAKISRNRITDAINYMNNNPNDEGKSYRKWFDGSGQQRLWNKVKNNLIFLRSKLSRSSNMTIRCNYDILRNPNGGGNKVNFYFTGRNSSTLAIGLNDVQVLIHESLHAANIAGDHGGKPVSLIDTPNKSTTNAGNYSLFINVTQ